MKYISILVTLLVFSSISYAQKSLLLNVKEGERYAFNCKMTSKTTVISYYMHLEMNADMIMEVQEVKSDSIKFKSYLTNIEMQYEMPEKNVLVSTRDVDTTGLDSLSIESMALMKSILNKEFEVYTTNKLEVIKIEDFWKHVLKGMANEDHLQETMTMLGPAFLTLTCHYLNTLYTEKIENGGIWENIVQLKGSKKDFFDYKCSLKVKGNKDNTVSVSATGKLMNTKDVKTSLEKSTQADVIDINGDYIANGQFRERDHWPLNAIIQNNFIITFEANVSEHEKEKYKMNMQNTVEVNGRKL